MHAKLQVLGKLLVELLVVVLLFGDLVEDLQALLHQILLDHSQDLVLLQGLPRNVQRQILRVHHTLHERQPLRNQLLTIIHDEHTTHVQLDVVPLLLPLEGVERSTSGHKQQCFELKLTLHRKVLHSQMVLPVVRQRLVERSVLLIRHILSLPHPQRLVLVQLLPLVAHLLHLLCLLLLLVLLSVLVHILDLRLIALLFLLLLLLVLGVSHLFLRRLLHVQLDGKTDELRMLLHKILQPTLLQKLRLILLQEANNLGPALHLSVRLLLILHDSERPTSSRLPNILLIIVALRDHSNLVRHQVRRVEPHTELTDHRHVASSRHRLHERLGSRLRNRPQVVHQLVLRHPDSGILDRESVVGLVWHNLDEEVRLRLHLLRVCDRLISDLVQRVRRI
mmetsp:Transcript_37998/g.86871  ORF Transcript_37998/g.86871 Transcript_37998/m.86871 type:complete len:393 (+) Transcript_37998:953-2131(+)